jgi:hypothetical protein
MPLRNPAELDSAAAAALRAIGYAYRLCEKEGLESALNKKPRSGKQRALDAGQCRGIIAMA